MAIDAPLMPELEASEWLNAPPVSIADQKGKVVLVYAFQMLCPGCVQHASPQIQKVRNFFKAELLTVIGLHSVFEHHDAMTPAALKAYIHEFKYDYPIAIDMPSDSLPIPKTMAKLGLQGTPTVLLVDKAGRLRRHFFGQIDDLRLGTEIGLLLAEDYAA
ncbi:MAG: redoxin family protein [Spirochaetes bacterium]|nr:redoxin family protein [Spirochaetota bacterium]